MRLSSEKIDATVGQNFFPDFAGLRQISAKQAKSESDFYQTVVSIFFE